MGSWRGVASPLLLSFQTILYKLRRPFSLCAVYSRGGVGRVVGGQRVNLVASQLSCVSHTPPPPPLLCLPRPLFPPFQCFFFFSIVSDD
jgi:hypothetical protein